MIYQAGRKACFFYLSVNLYPLPLVYNFIAFSICLGCILVAYSRKFVAIAAV